MNLGRILAGTAVFLSFSGAAAAQQSNNALLHAMAGCAGLSNDVARLSCYDQLAPQVKAALAAPAPAVAPVAAAPAPAAAPAAPSAPRVAAHTPTKKEQSSWFGFDMGDLFGSSPKTQTTPAQFGSDQLPQTQEPAKAAPQAIDSITAGITDYATNPFGKFVVFLDNGQIWRQLQGDSDILHFPRHTKGLKVEIERGLLGSYNLHLVGSERIFKVQRIK